MEKETININGKEYVLKGSESIKEKVERFDYKIEEKLLKKVKKFFNIYNEANEELLLIENKAVIDPANVTLIYSNTEKGKRFLCKLIDLQENDIHGNLKDIPTLDFSSDKNESITKLSLEYLSFWVGFLEIISDSVKITSKKDHPIKLECEDFTIITAPRVDSEDEE